MHVACNVFTVFLCTYIFLNDACFPSVEFRILPAVTLPLVMNVFEDMILFP